MKNFKLNKKSIIAVLAIASMVGLYAPVTALAATSPSLGTSATYGVLSNTFNYNTGLTSIVGNLGYSGAFPGGGATLTVSGSTQVANGSWTQAGIDQNNALNNVTDGLNIQTCTSIGAVVALNAYDTDGAGPLPPGTFPPGCYSTTGAMNITTGTTVTLSGAGTYIFRPGGALGPAANSIVALSGASACDVFWAPIAATTIGANSTFVGTVIDAAGITIGSTVSWIGRALGYGGTITADTDTITVPACAGNVGSSISGGQFLPLPVINITKVPSPISLPLGAGSVTYTYTATNIGPVAMSNVSVIDNKCTNVNFISGDTNSNSKLDLTESWIYSCTKTVSQTETNIVSAQGHANGYVGYDTAIATVIVGVPVVPPLINLIKVPSKFTLPYGGGPVSYAYNVTNPGTVPLNNVTVSDDKCTGLPARVAGHPGDLNKNNLLDTNETFYFTCASNLTKTTTNIGTATGYANGLTAVDFASATVVVTVPALPNTGYGPEDKNLLSILVPAGLLALLLAFYVTRKKHTV